MCVRGVCVIMMLCISYLPVFFAMAHATGEIAIPATFHRVLIDSFSAAAGAWHLVFQENLFAYAY